MSVKAEALAVSSLIEWLGLSLITKVVTVNGERKPYIKALVAGPYEFSVDSTLRLAIDDLEPSSYSSVAITAGSYTATQMAALVSVSGITASVDTADRFTLTRSAAPSTANRAIVVGPDSDSTNVNYIFGWDAGGEREFASPIVAPNRRAIMDGWPQQLDVSKFSTGKSPFLVVIGRRTTVPVEPNPRRDEHIVTLELSLFRMAQAGENHRSREHISACVQCVREVLQTDAGLQLGRASSGDIVKVEVGRVVVEAMRFQQMQRGKPFGPAFDSAAMTVYVKTFERPAAS